MKALLLLHLLILSSGALLSSSATSEKDIVATAAETGQLGTLARALEAAGLVEALQGEGPFTVFAATDEAFAQLPDGTLETLLQPEHEARLQRTLKHHVVAGALPAAQVLAKDYAETLSGQRLELAIAGDTVKVDGATVIKADMRCSNGIIHVIDAVLLPEDGDLLEVVEAAGECGTLVKAVRAAGLSETLSGAGPFTVFAPTDEAFAALPEGTLESLLHPANEERLKTILTYHVVSGARYGDQLAESGRAPTLQGGSLQVRTGDDEMKIGEATVRRADIEASNGVVHVVDKVLLPR